MENISIAPNTPIYGVVNLLNHIQKNRLSNLDWQIAENPNSGYIYAFSEDLPYTLIGNDEECYKFFYLPYGGEEFSEHDYNCIDFDDLHWQDKEAYLEILNKIIATDEAIELAENLTADTE
jgi:hypothetical protein